jgi:quercetin dioxygenase-like cupin family protein
MAVHHAASGEVIDLAPYGETFSDAASTALFKTQELEVIRMVLHAGKEVPEHSVPGEMTLQCLKGKVELRLQDGTRSLQEGQLACLEGNAPYAFYADEDSLLLLTILLKHADANQAIRR